MNKSNRSWYGWPSMCINTQQIYIYRSSYCEPSHYSWLRFTDLNYMLSAFVYVWRTCLRMNNNPQVYEVM